MNRFVYSALAALLFATFSWGCAPRHPRTTPPEPQVEQYGDPPGPDYFWVKGHWRWEGRRYVWTPGHWAQGGHGNWVPGHWERRGRRWVWVAGHMR